ncbi:hypothetical protein [Streptomyces sp. bgisy084]|uniref:hypothetical protein n=1 Tax=unclassified Streptomyces TaxID=2593676 RepID=UPI003D72A7B5
MFNSPVAHANWASAISTATGSRTRACLTDRNGGPPNNRRYTAYSFVSSKRDRSGARDDVKALTEPTTPRRAAWDAVGQQARRMLHEVTDQPGDEAQDKHHP